MPDKLDELGGIEAVKAIRRRQYLIAKPCQHDTEMKINCCNCREEALLDRVELLEKKNARLRETIGKPADSLNIRLKEI